MKRTVRIFGAIVEIVSGQAMAWLVLVLMVLTLVEAVSRYALRQPFMIADEIGGYMVVTIIIMGLAYTWKEGRHISIDFLVIKLPPRVRQWLRLAVLVIVIATTLLLIRGNYDFVMTSFEIGRKSETWLRLPLAWPQMVLVIGSVLLLFQLIVEFTKAITAIRTKGRADEH